MCIIVLMNKDVIYIEPEDDITDILTGIKNSKTKIVALVPPKKTGVLRSAVNFKLLAKTAQDTGKAVVLITSDIALLKLAASTKILVAKNLQTKPEIPTGDTTAEEGVSEDDIVDDLETKIIVKDDQDAKTEAKEEVIESADLDEENIGGEEEPSGKKKKKKSLVPNLEKYRKFIIMGAVGLVLLVGFLIWALVIAPSAHIAVTVKTSARAFSETISFTNDVNKADPIGGLFLLEAQTLTKESSVEFEATGETDKGVKATGTLTVYRSGASSATALNIPKGTKFTLGEVSYTSNEAVTLRGAEGSADVELCGITSPPCFKPNAIKADIKVTAEFPGTKHNIEASATGWTTTIPRIVVASSAMTGGTSRIVKIVSAEDIRKAKEELGSVSASEGRTELVGEFATGLIPISSSFRSESSEPVAVPALGEEVTEGTTPKLTTKTTFSMFGVDRVKIAEFVEARMMEVIADEEDQEIYATGVSDNADENKAFVESFHEVDGKYVAKLKTTAKIGPEVTDQMVREKSLGRKIGEVQSMLKSIKGVSAVRVETSVFWVTSVPNDTNRITVEITVE